MSSETAVTTPGSTPASDDKKTVRDLLRSDDFRVKLSEALPKHVSVDRYMSVVVTATLRNPDLFKCSPASFYRAALELSQLGLSPDGRRAHLIPFRNMKRGGIYEVQLIVDYKGIVELVRQSGDVSYIHADAVYPNDQFMYAYGTGAFLKHVPPFTNRGDAPVAFYSFVRLKDGSEDFAVMSKGDVDKIRARSKAKDSGPWVTDYDQMGMKTVFRRHSKWLPFSADSRKAIELDDEAGDGDALEDAEQWEQPAEQPRAQSLRDKILSQPSFLEPEAADAPDN